MPSAIDTAMPMYSAMMPSAKRMQPEEIATSTVSDAQPATEIRARVAEEEEAELPHLLSRREIARCLRLVSERRARGFEISTEEKSRT